MTEQFQLTNGIQAPNSHITGRLPICGIFASPGVNCSHAMIAQHGFGIGDHRVHLFDFDAQALLGESYPSLVAPTGRKLVCSVDRIRRNGTTSYDGANRYSGSTPTPHACFSISTHVQPLG